MAHLHHQEYPKGGVSLSSTFHQIITEAPPQRRRIVGDVGWGLAWESRETKQRRRGRPDLTDNSQNALKGCVKLQVKWKDRVRYQNLFRGGGCLDITPGIGRGIRVKKGKKAEN